MRTVKARRRPLKRARRRLPRRATKVDRAGLVAALAALAALFDERSER